MNRKEILQVLPHRGAMLLVDDIIEIVPGQRVLGYKKVRENEFWSEGHFPGNPIFPGVLQIELMAQTSLFLFCEAGGSAKIRPMLAKVDQMKLLQPVGIGDELYVSVKTLAEGGGFLKAETAIYLDVGLTKAVARGKLTCYLEKEE
ncbi:MAG: 3-hydroxyacyl-ACP dehydratase FabZ family protein [Blautia sp.]